MTDIEKVRLLIADTSAPYHYTDAQIQGFLDMGGSVMLAAALALEAWAASISSNEESEKIGDYAYTKKEASNKLALAARYREQDQTTPVSTWAELNLTGETEEE